MDIELTESKIEELRHVWQRINERLPTRDTKFLQDVFCHCAAAGIDPDVFCDAFFSEMYHQAYQVANNPLFAWHAYADFRSMQRPIPDWVMGHIDLHAVALLNWACSDSHDEKSLKAAIGITDLRQAENYASSATKMGAVAELLERTKEADHGQISRIMAEISDAHNISVEGLKKWKKAWAAVVKL